ncbi:MAG: ribbon-helix-helix protein, CopG family [Caldilineaceae bacterium]|nr:ribbon-helix-helix protein, CopG family [Caldilineaceae bacterium]
MKRTTILADEDLLYRLDKLAKRQKTTKSQLIREALEAYVEQRETESPPANPLLKLANLAGDRAVPMDLSDGKDEELIRETVDPRLGFTQQV